LNPVLAILKPNPYYHGPRPHAVTAIGLITGLLADTAVARFPHRTSDLIELPDPALHPTGSLARRYGGAANANGPPLLRGDLEQTHFIALNARGRALLRSVAPASPPPAR